MWWRCFLWATESCCAINLLLFSCYFFVWDDEEWDFVVTVDLSVLSAQHRCCIILYPAPGLLHKFFTPRIVWLNKYVIGLNRWPLRFTDKPLLWQNESSFFLSLLIKSLRRTLSLLEVTIFVNCCITVILLTLFVHHIIARQPIGVVCVGINEESSTRGSFKATHQVLTE